MSHRQREVATGLTRAREGGYGVLFATFTCSHNKWRYLPNNTRELVRLRDVLEPLLEAQRWLRGGTRVRSNAWAGFREQFGYVGQIRAAEFTHGKRGWHPHLHNLMVFAPGSDLGGAAAWLQREYLKALAASGLRFDPKRPELACTVRESGWTEGEYLAKVGHKRGWDIDAELTRGHVKHASAGNLTPWDMLNGVATGNDDDGVMAGLFREYARATFRHNHVTWSPGLKARFGIAQVDDVTIAQSDDAPELAELLGFLTRSAFRQMRLHGLEGQILYLAQHEGWEAVQAFLGGVYVPREQCPAPTVAELEAFARGEGAALLDVSGLCPADEF